MKDITAMLKRKPLVKERALRYNSNKTELFYPLTFPEALRGISRVSTYGAGKYTLYNYLKGAPASESVGSTLRHLLAWWNGEDIDPESQLNHLDHFAWNAARLTNEMLGDKKDELDDRPRKVLNQENTTAKFAVDVDGVFANFPQGFIDRAKKLGHGFNFPMNWTVVPDWNFGVDPEIWKQVWEGIEIDLDFWVNLEPMQEIPFVPLAYVTARPFEHITEAWLFKHGFPHAPVVVVSEDRKKPVALNEIGAKIYIDDKYENYKLIKESGIICFLQDRPWNRHKDVGDDRVLSVADAVKQLDNRRKIR